MWTNSEKTIRGKDELAVGKHCDENRQHNFGADKRLCINYVHSLGGLPNMPSCFRRERGGEGSKEYL